MSVIVIVTLTALPDRKSNLCDILSPLTPISRNHKGNEGYDVVVRPKNLSEDSNIVLVVEKWATEEDFGNHVKQPEVEEALANIGEHVADIPQIDMYETLEASVTS
jgi:quinol monooxygenase YgiN